MNRGNKVGWALVIFFLLGGAIFTIVMPEIGIGQIWMAVALFLGALYFLLGRFANRVTSQASPNARKTLKEALDESSEPVDRVDGK